MRWYDVMFQHVQLTPLELRLQRRFREQMFWPNTLLLHSSVETGRVKTLLHTEMGQEWMTWPRTVWHIRIIGVHVDAERIYVAHWSASERGRGLAFLLSPKDRPKTPLRPVRVRYQRHVWQNRRRSAAIRGRVGRAQWRAACHLQGRAAEARAQRFGKLWYTGVFFQAAKPLLTIAHRFRLIVN